MEVMRRAMLDKSVVPTIRSAFKDNLAVPVEPVHHGSARTSSRSNSGSHMNRPMTAGDNCVIQTTALQRDVESLNLACSNAWEHVERARRAIRPVLRLNADASEAKEVVSRLQSELLALNAVGDRLAELAGLGSASKPLKSKQPQSSVAAVPVAFANWTSAIPSGDSQHPRIKRSSQQPLQNHRPIESTDITIDMEGHAELF